ncbi:MAG TPA: hypothetical protein VIM56_02370 [Rhizomicrobium sp.]
MVAYRRIDEVNVPPSRKHALSHELFHGLTPEEFDNEARTVAEVRAMTPAVRRRMEAHLTERLLTPPDAPSWGPDWIHHGDRFAPRRGSEKPGLFSRIFKRDDEEDDEVEASPDVATDEDYVIARNMEKSRQIAHYRWLYAAAIGITLLIAFAAMFVDYQIIRGDVWTRALSNEFMVVPAALQSTLVFKSLQVVFAVLIIHFMLKITGVYGRNAMVVAAFVLALVMIGGLGYLVAYNNMTGGTSTTLEHQQSNDTSGNAIDRLFQTDAPISAENPVRNASLKSSSEYSLGLPKLSQSSLADADSWFWFAFASVIFFIVTIVAALYIQGAENNMRNVMLARDYKHRQRQFAQLHLLQLADKREAARGEVEA